MINKNIARILMMVVVIILALMVKVEAVTLTTRFGNEYVDVTVEKDEMVNLKFTSKIGFRFKRWVIEEGILEDIDITKNEINFSMPDSDVVIRGEYDTTYRITFDINDNGDGSGEMADMLILAGGSEDLTLNTFSRTGYSFKGWSIEDDDTVEYENGANCTPTNDLTLYAVWELITYTIEYNGNGSTSGSTESSIHTYGVEQELTANGYSKTGYKFAGWAETADGEVKYRDKQVVNLTEEGNKTITLYAKWIISSTAYLAKGEYIKLNNGPSTISVSTNAASSQALSVKNTVWRVQSTTNGVIKVTPDSSLGNLTLKGSIDWRNAETIKSDIITKLTNTGFFVSGDMNHNISLSYLPTYSFWGFDTYDQKEYYVGKYMYRWNSTEQNWNMTVLYDGSSGDKTKSSGILLLMEIDVLNISGGSGSASDPYIVKV